LFTILFRVIVNIHESTCIGHVAYSQVNEMVLIFTMKGESEGKK